MQIGVTILPRNIPNLNHNLFGILSVCGAKKARNRKIIDIPKVQILGLFPSINGNKPRNKKKIAKTIPKLLSELILTETLDLYSDIIHTLKRNRIN